MKRSFRSVVLAAAMIAAAVPFCAQAADEADAPTAIVSIYRIAPGKHLEFLRWLAAREAVDKAVGVPATQVYMHRSGAAWDFISIAPETTPEQDARVEAEAKKRGLATGFKAALEIRTLMAEHSDTLAEGPVTATQLAAEAQ